MPNDEHAGRWLKAETVAGHEVWVTKRATRWYVAVRALALGTGDSSRYPRPEEILPLRYDNWATALEAARAEIERRQGPRRRPSQGTAEPGSSDSLAGSEL